MSGGSVGWVVFVVIGDDMVGGDVVGEFVGDRIVVMVFEERDGGMGVEELLMLGGWGVVFCVLVVGLICLKLNSCVGIF